MGVPHGGDTTDQRNCITLAIYVYYIYGYHLREGAVHENRVYYNIANYGVLRHQLFHQEITLVFNTLSASKINA